MAEREPSLLREEPEASAEGGDDAAKRAAPARELEEREAKKGEAEKGEAEKGEAKKDEAKKDEAKKGEAKKRDPASRAGPVVPTYYVAGFWRRLAAGLLDLGVLLPSALILSWLAGALTGLHLPASRHHGLDIWLDLFLAADPALLGLVGLTLAVGAVYALVFQITLGRTLGMRALKIRIIDLYGDEPSTLRALARTGGYLAGVATIGLGFLWVGFDSEKRGLHDWLSGTYVVRA